jgi:5-formyltetrahydrofolate cyclo-ligase
MSIKEEKEASRKEIRKLKKLATIESMHEESYTIFKQVEELPVFKSAQTVLAYWSLADEVFTHDFVKKWYLTKRILLPIVVGDTLELKVFTGMDCMEVGPSFGILEPRKGIDFNNEVIDLAIIPGIAFDMSGNRLGRGKGYYDKLLKPESIYKVGVAFSFQILPKVPVDSFDIQMDIVIHS